MRLLWVYMFPKKWRHRNKPDLKIKENILQEALILVNNKGNTGNNCIEGGGTMRLESNHRDSLLESLVDIRDVRIDRSLPMEERVKSYVEQVKNPYMFKVGNTVVRVSYADTDKTMNDNFVNMISAM